jgi:hypothetical protein
MTRFRKAMPWFIVGIILIMIGCCITGGSTLSIPTLFGNLGSGGSYDSSSSGWDWGSGSDSGSWDWDSGSDSGSWDSGSDSGSWDFGGSDSGSWDSGGSDSGSW